MSSGNAHVFRDEEEAGGKLGRKAAESPFMIVGKLLKISKRVKVWLCNEKCRNFPFSTLTLDKILYDDKIFKIKQFFNFSVT